MVFCNELLDLLTVLQATLDYGYHCWTLATSVKEISPDQQLDASISYGLWSIFAFCMPDLWLRGNILRELQDSRGLFQLCLMLLQHHSSIMETCEDRKRDQNRIPQLSLDDN